MSEAYRNAKAGRLTFKGGDVAGVDKKKKKKKNIKRKNTTKKASAENAGENPTDGAEAAIVAGDDAVAATAVAEEGEVYTIDPAKRLKYEELFPVESKKFSYDPANKSRSGARTVEEALDDRVRKKADRYCK